MLNNHQRLKDISPVYIWDKLNIEKADVLVEIGAGTAFLVLFFYNKQKLRKSLHATYQK